MKTILLPKKPIYIPSRDNEDIYELFLRMEEECESCFLYESLGEYGDLARYTICGFDPQETVLGNPGKLQVGSKVIQTKNPYTPLSKLIPQDILAKEYAGGLVGYLGYDCVSLFEPSLSIKHHPLFPLFQFGMYTDGVIYDKFTGELTYFYFTKNRLPRILEFLARPAKKKKVRVKNLRPNTTKQEHAAMVSKVQDEIKKGNTFQTVIGMQETFDYTGDAIVLYDRLRKVSPAPFMYYIKFGPSASSGSHVIIGVSPELLFSMRDGLMHTFPLAGTRSRGQTAQKDKELAYDLLHDIKEKAEHTMLVDLHRNDMGKVARFGTVKIQNVMDIKRFSHVQHLGSEITGIIRSDENMFTALASNFPAGTLSGAPKIESMKIIDRLEKAPRGPYGGAVGHFGFNGDATFAISIRTIFISGNTGFIQAGGGIVADSVVEDEYGEIQRKLQGIKEVLRM